MYGGYYKWLTLLAIIMQHHYYHGLSGASSGFTLKFLTIDALITQFVYFLIIIYMGSPPNSKRSIYCYCIYIHIYIDVAQMDFIGTIDVRSYDLGFAI